MDYERLSIPEATRIQQELRSRLDIRDRDLQIDTVAGADISLNLYSTTIYAGIILLSLPQLQPIAYSLVRSETRFPYVPGFLAFREAPALVQAWKQMPEKPGVLVVDGHGIAHPRRMGIASHFGALTGQPTLGCAKKLLYGRSSEPGPAVGDAAPLMSGSEQIGHVFRSKSRTAPVFISPGHLIGMDNCLDIMRRCTGRYRIPEPTRLAHELVNRFRRGELQEGYHKL